MIVFLSILLIILNCNNKIFVSSSTLCDSPKLCENSEIIDDYAICSGFRGCDTSSITTTSSIYCYGAYGCMNSTSLTADGSVYCYGMYGCYNSSEILSGGNVYCDGYYGCRDIDNGIQSDNYVYCDGDYSCREDKIESGKHTSCNGNYACYKAAINSGNDVICDGDSSCYYAQLQAENNVYCYGKASCRSSSIETEDYVYSYGYYASTDANITATRIYGYGYWGLSNSIIDSKQLQSMNVYSYGYYTGYGATVICRDNSECLLECKGTGCYRTDYICYPGSDCTLEPKECVDDDVSVAMDGSYCPTFITSDNIDDSDKLNKYIKQRIIDTSNDPKYRQIKSEFERNDNEFEARMKTKQMEADISFNDDINPLKLTLDDGTGSESGVGVGVLDKQKSQNNLINGAPPQPSNNNIKRNDIPNNKLLTSKINLDLNKLDKINQSHSSSYTYIYTHLFALFCGSILTQIIMYYYFTKKQCIKDTKKQYNYYGEDSEYQPLA